MPSSKNIVRNIVDLVERAGGPVTLVNVERQVPGFLERDSQSPSWSYEVGDEENVIWDRMTADGCKALRLVLREGLVALCPMSPLLYLVERRWPSASSWVPIGLAPANMANIRGHGRLFCYRDQFLVDETMRLARARGDAANWLLLKAA